MRLKKRSIIAGKGRLENLKELIQAMAEFDTLPAYLEHISLVMDVDTSGGLAEDQVSLMTLHSAKGLEFPLVFLPGWEEGMFPSQKSMDESGMAGLEEERRLAYVGITRAMQKLHLTSAWSRMLHGTTQYNPPSRFLDEIPAELIEEVGGARMLRSKRDRGSYGSSGSSFTANVPVARMASPF